MIIEIRKAGFTNKGAELMLRVIMERLRTVYPEATLVMAPSLKEGPQPFQKVVQNGFYPKAWLYHYGIQWGRLAGLLPGKLRGMYGLILDKEVDVVIDAAGFSYSDQWGARTTRELAHSSVRWRRQGTKVILMPQAFGPYNNKRSRRYIEKAITNIDLAMPRERTSYAHLTSAVGERSNIRQFPDFTNLVEGIIPASFDSASHRVCLVPNYRMIEKTNRVESAAYLPFMIHCARYLEGRGAKPFLLVHEGVRDERLAQNISEAVGGIPVLQEDDPVKIKGILGASYATIGSRFHGLVSALSQGVPSLATGWSHKYIELFKDYGFPEGVLSVDTPEPEVNENIDRIIDEPSNKKISDSLLQKSAEFKQESEEMWEQVFATIGR